MQKILFIDRDGVILQEPPGSYQVDSIEKMRFVPKVLGNLSKLSSQLGFYTVMVTNQDGLGTDSFPEEGFWECQNLMLRTLEGEGFVFNEIHIDRSFAIEGKPTRKPGIAMVEHLLTEKRFDIEKSFMIGDRWTDIAFAKNLGCKAIYLRSPLENLLITSEQKEEYKEVIALETDNWDDIYSFLRLSERRVTWKRVTNETYIDIILDLDGTGIANIQTGLGFFDHMLHQLARHGNIDLQIITKGDLHIDEHHTIEDTGIALGEAFAKALTDKRGMERYGFALPMDDSEAKVLIDFGGRNWIVWNVLFEREKVGDVPTEMFFHFFKSFSDAAKCNLNISCKGDNEHHKIEAIFKAFAKAIRMAIKRDPLSNHLPTTKGIL